MPVSSPPCTVLARHESEEVRFALDSPPEQTGFEPSVPPIRETVVDTTSWLAAPPYFACVALNLEHAMLRKIGDSLSAIPDTGSEW